MSGENQSADDVSPHDDFELVALYSSFSQEVPTINRIIMEAEKFGNSHRHLINKFCLEPTISTKKMNLLFTKHFTTVKLQKHPEVVMRIQATPEDSKKLSKALVKTMNNEEGKQKKQFRPWRFVISTNEKTPIEYVTMTGCTRNSSIISESSDLTKAERALFLAILDEMMSLDGAVSMSNIQHMIKTEPHKMPQAKMDTFLTRMIRQKYFVMDEEKDFLEICPRTLVELEPWIRAKFVGELKLCTLCTKIISRPIYTAECQKCGALFHFNCFKSATEFSKQEHIECGKCKEKLTTTEVEDQINTKKLEGVLRSRLRSANPRSTRVTPVQVLDTDDEEGAIGKEGEKDKQPSTSKPKKATKRKNKRIPSDSDSD